jgi:hypothetical protein
MEWSEEVGGCMNSRYHNIGTPMFLEGVLEYLVVVLDKDEVE